MTSAGVAKRKPSTPVRRRGSQDVIDIDAAMLEELGPPPADDEIPKKQVKVLGEDFHIYATPNIFGALRVGADPDDTSSIYWFLIYLVAEEDRKRFISALARRADLTDERLGFIMRQMLEAVTAPHPTSSPTGSGRTRSRTTSKALSAGS